MKDISKSIIGKIKKDHIKPHSKSHFIVKRSFFWSVIISALILGALAFSFVIFQLTTIEWSIHDHFTLAAILPYFWILIATILIVLAIHFFRHTRKGYRHNWMTIIGASFVILFLLSGIMYATQIPDRLERRMIENPHYQKIAARHELVWKELEKGRFGGKILEIKTPDTIIIQNPALSEPCEIDISLVPEKDLLKKGMMIHMMGEQTGDCFFKASQIQVMFKRQLPEDVSCKFKKMKENLPPLRMKK